MMHLEAVWPFLLKSQPLLRTSTLRCKLPSGHRLSRVKYYVKPSFGGNFLQPLARSGFQHLSGARYQSSHSNVQPNLEVSSAIHSPESDGSGADIQIIDYSRDRIVMHKLDSSSLDAFLQTQPKPSWSACRWIYVNGLDQHAVKSLGAHKDLHPLALEDVLDRRTATKANWYENHCYLEMCMVKLTDFHHMSESGQPQSKDETSLENRAMHSGGTMRLMRPPTEFATSWEQVSAFLTADNTIITFFESSGPDVLAPVLDRLQSSQTVLRSSDDPSMLVHAVIDVVVDMSLPIGKRVAEIFDHLERAVLHNPTIPQSKQLHILRSGLTLLLNNTNSIGGLVKTLCDHRAVADLHNTPQTPTNSQTNPLANSVQISPMAQIYFQDVQDHIHTLATSTHMSIRSAENLSSLIFNSITASQNESVRKLTLVSSFFLPLTFLTSYFGMNFDPMPSVNENSELFFWLIATPVMFGTLFMLTIGTRISSLLRRRMGRLRRAR